MRRPDKDFRHCWLRSVERDLSRRPREHYVCSPKFISSTSVWLQSTDHTHGFQYYLYAGTPKCVLVVQAFILSFVPALSPWQPECLHVKVLKMNVWFPFPWMWSSLGLPASSPSLLALNQWLHSVPSSWQEPENHLGHFPFSQLHLVSKAEWQLCLKSQLNFFEAQEWKSIRETMKYEDI